MMAQPDPICIYELDKAGKSGIVHVKRVVRLAAGGFLDSKRGVRAAQV
jgi:hypothetical protein